MAEQKITLAELPLKMRVLALQFPEAVVRAAHLTAEMDGLRQVQLSISRARPQPVDTGDYKASWRTERLANGAMLYAESAPRVKAGVIEMGRRPGKGIPIAPLSEWVRRKLGVADPKKAARIAMAISIKHKQLGRPGLHILGNAMPEIKKAFQKRVQQEVNRAMKGGR